MITISDQDRLHYILLRENIDRTVFTAAEKYDRPGFRILDVAPQVHEGAKKYFELAEISTLDIDPESGADYICDLAHCDSIADDTFDLVFCTEVLEHTDDPFGSVSEIHRILKPMGMVIATTPFNFRIHRPLPDNWRFTEHGLRLLFKKFKCLEITELPTSDRDLMPIQYTIRALK
jgi:SAM-dependent methyltransferase